MPSSIAVVYCFDKGYAPYAAVSAFSLASSTQSALKVFWVVPEKDKTNVIPVLKAVEQKTGQSITLITVSSNYFDGWKVDNHISSSAYLRLLIPTLIDEPKVIYLDADTIVLSDLSAFFSIDLGDHLFAGVQDPGESASKIPRSPGDPYLNSGVLLMNLEALRYDGLLEKARTLYREYEHELVWHDQCLINKYADGRKLVVPSQWNRLVHSYGFTEASFDALLKDEQPAILHFVTQFKPWQRWCTPAISNFWWRYANELGIEGLKPQTVTGSNANHALAVVNYLEEHERFSEASSLKDKIIDDLRTLIHTRESETTA